MPLSQEERIRWLEQLPKKLIDMGELDIEDVDYGILVSIILDLKAYEELKKRIDVEKFREIIKELRDHKCIACEYRYDRNGCILHQVKNQNHCLRNITGEDIIKAIVSYLEEWWGNCKTCRKINQGGSL